MHSTSMGVGLALQVPSFLKSIQSVDQIRCTNPPHRDGNGTLFIAVDDELYVLLL